MIVHVVFAGSFPAAGEVSAIHPWAGEVAGSFREAVAAGGSFLAVALSVAGSFRAVGEAAVCVDHYFPRAVTQQGLHAGKFP